MNLSRFSAVVLIGDVPSATAILDRFLHHAEIITITGRSYRLKDRAVKDEKPDTEPAPNDRADETRTKKKDQKNTAARLVDSQAT